MATSAVSRFRAILWTLVIVAAIGATGLYVFRQPTMPIGVIGTPFALETTTGQPFTDADLKGTPSLVFFGYTFCPDVCRTTMAESVEWKKELGLIAGQLRTIFVTVDPARDTKQVLADYLGSFDASIIGLSGSAAATEAAKTSFGVFSENQAPDKNGSYIVNHTASVFLIGKQAEFEGTIAYGEDKASALAKIKRLIAG